MMRHVLIPLTVLLAAVSGRAADLDPYLPEDSEVVINVNVRQIVDSTLFKNNALEAAQETLRGNDQIQDILKDLGFDPFKDFDRLIVAAPIGAENDRGLLIAHGRFDTAKFKAKGEEAAKDNPDNLTIHKVLGGKHLLYEVNTPDLNSPIFVALAGRDTILVSPGKDYVVAALKKIGQAEKPALKNKNFQSLLEKVNDRQSLSVALVKAPAVEDALAKLPGDVKGMAEKIQAVSGGVTITDEVKLELVLTTKDAEEAKDLKESANAGLTLILGVLGAFAQNDAKPEVEFLLEAAKSLRVTNKGEAVIIKGRISSDLIEDTLKKKGK
ncbi:MAG TPA: hypothetical protein VH575_01120 [Gemmataceae bacterium]|jgi:hypothetical protein